MPTGVYIRTVEYRKALSLAMKKVVFTEEHKLNLSRALKGRKHTEETKKKISMSKKGQASFKGKFHTEETKRKIGMKSIGRIKSAEGRKRISMAVSGSKNWNWKGGVTTKDRLERIKFRNQIQRQVFKRDNYTCKLCGEKGGKLQVDHIQSWAEYIELRFSINNCRTLCMKCHYKITFGKPMPPSIKAWGHNLVKSQIQL